MTPKEKKNISLVKTDYDDFKDLSFFLDQQTKAEAMLREVEEFKKSFVMSKMISMDDWVRKNPTYGLWFFDNPRLVIKFYLDKLFGYIYVNYNPKMHWFSPKLATGWSQNHWCDHYYLEQDKYPKSKQKVLDQFFKDCHRHIQESSTNGLAEWVDTGEKDKDGFRKTEYVPFTDDSQSIYILDWRKYTKPETIKEIEEEYVQRCETAKVDSHAFYKKFDKIKDQSKILYVDKIIAEIEKRFATAISYIRELYIAHPDILCEDLVESESGRYFNFNPKKNNCVVWKSRPRWVSNNLEKVKITTSDDRKKIFCEFKDTKSYKRFNFTGYHTQETRICELTYSAKNNELTDYKVYFDKIEISD